SAMDAFCDDADWQPSAGLGGQFAAVGSVVVVVVVVLVVVVGPAPTANSESDDVSAQITCRTRSLLTVRSTKVPFSAWGICRSPSAIGGSMSSTKPSLSSSR